MLPNVLVLASGLICAFSPNYWLFGFGRFLAGWGRIGVYAIGLVLGTLHLFIHLRYLLYVQSSFGTQHMHIVKYML